MHSDFSLNYKNDCSIGPLIRNTFLCKKSRLRFLKNKKAVRNCAQKKKNDKKRSSKKSINIVLPVIRRVARGNKKWPPVCTDGTHVPVQLTDSTPTRSSKSVNVGERGTTVNWRLTFTAPPSALCHRVVGLLPCSSRRLHTCNDHRMEKEKTMAAVRRKRKLLRWKQETGEIRNRCNILG